MRRFLPLLFLLLPIYALCQDPPKQDAPKKGGGRGAPKNLKVLDPSVNIRQVMATFTTGLGVQCTFCHMLPDFASDENPKKEIARHMISMTKEINAKFPDGKDHVACYTCHRGANMPLMAPPAAQ
jgi:Photosynthetic reaction centre cytochrome C subunit